MFNKKCKIAAIAAAVGGALLAASSQAAEFYFGEDDSISLTINSEVSVGASWLMNDPARETYFQGNTFNGINGTGAGSATDDGSLNFGDGDMFSQVYKGFTDFDINAGDFGFFARVKYWYDKELEDGNRPHGNSINGYVANQPLSDEGYSDFVKFSGIELMDAYAYYSFDAGDVPVDIRLGRQVVNWGESVFIQGGVNAINPIDVASLRRPGVELEEALLPVGMLYVQAGLTGDLSVEAFYQYEWEKFQIDGCGTLFSEQDFTADGCNWVTVGANDFASLQDGFAAKRRADIEPDDGGQYGVALRYYAEEIDTELSFYAMNIHSRLPSLSLIRSSWIATPAATPFVPWASVRDALAVADIVNAFGGDLAAASAATNIPVETLGGAAASAGLFNALGANTREAVDALNPGYLAEFVEDLKVYGLSFATTLSGFSVSGELSFKPDTPVTLNGSYIVQAGLTENPVLPLVTQRLLSTAPGELMRGWDAFDQTQFQVNALKFYERVLGASRLTVIAEAAVTKLDGIKEASAQGLVYGRDPVYGLSLPITNTGVPIDFTDFTGGKGGFDGYVTEMSWGYRARAVLNYSDVFAGININPTISFAHDVNGVSGTQFQEGRKTLGLAVEALYMNKYSATIGYTNYSGGSHNVLKEKDFVSLSFGVSF